MLGSVYRLTPTTKLFIKRGDITTFVGDALVNAANERMLGGGGVDGAIHRAAGPELREACLAVAPVERAVRCPTGEARLTPGNFGSLRVTHVIHTVGPIYDDAEASAPLLTAAYRSSMTLANEHGLESVAFPAISCGVYGYPLGEAADIALTTCRENAGSVKEVHFFLFGKAEEDAWERAADATLENEEEGKEEPSSGEGEGETRDSSSAEDEEKEGGEKAMENVAEKEAEKEAEKAAEDEEERKEEGKKRTYEMIT